MTDEACQLYPFLSVQRGDPPGNITYLSRVLSMFISCSLFRTLGVCSGPLLKASSYTD